jgi:penicillin-binding protein 1C
LRQRYPQQAVIRSTLDAGAQRLVERTVALRTRELHDKTIFGGAVVVADHATREVIALAGNLDFDDTKHGGQIAMFDRRRSPGSTLKPFLYAMAIDRGFALPGYLVADVPNQYGTYRPRNFDNDFAGLVTLREALSKSLNLPFVDLLARIGVEHFLGDLDRMGVSGARAVPGTYGLSMIVGSIELTPLEIAGLYVTLAQDGAHAPLRLVAGDPIVPPVRIFAPGAAHLTRQALSEKDRPDFPRRRDVTVPSDIHWKTGTSFGYRDAWSVGSGPRYTAVVWTGNVDNRPAVELVGSEAAGPILFDVLEGLSDRTRKTAAVSTPGDLTEIEVCGYSGHIATDACPSRVRVSALLHAVPTQPCPFHHAYEVDRESGHAILPACRKPGHDYEQKTFVVLPSSVTAWMRDRHRVLPEAPVFDANCVADAGPPIMVTPSENQIITLIPGMPERNQSIPFTVSTRAATVSWFVDGALIGSGPASERVFWTPTRGKHEIVVADATGRKARRRLEVR